MKGIHVSARRPLLPAVLTSAATLAVFGVQPMTAGATTGHHSRHHHRRHGLRFAGFSKPAPATVTISQISPSPLLDNYGPLLVAVTRTGSTKKALNVTLNTTDGTAFAGTDYTGGPYAVTIPKGQTNTNVSIPITDDETEDSNEDFSLSLAKAPRGTVVVGGSQTATIINDDQSGSFTVPDGYTISLTGSLAGCDQLQDALVNLSNHGFLAGLAAPSGGCDTTSSFNDTWANATGSAVSVGVQLIDTTCANATYESDDQDMDIFDNGGAWFTGDHNAIWTDLGGTTNIAMTDAASCSYPTDREPTASDQGNLQGTITITPTPS
jgi:hypothetical protein